jgi:hypothetical protein
MATYQLSDGRTVSDSMAFTLDDIQYPSNWLLLSSEQDRTERGITGPLPEPPWYDQRFCWGPDQPKDHAQLVEEYVGHVKRNAGAMISQTDWMVTRSAEPNGKPVSQEVLDYRAAIRLASDAKEAAIAATTDTAELAAYITGTEYPVWPSDSTAPVESVAIDGLELAFNGGATGGAII